MVLLIPIFFIQIKTSKVLIRCTFQTFCIVAIGDVFDTKLKRNATRSLKNTVLERKEECKDTINTTKYSFEESTDYAEILVHVFMRMSNNKIADSNFEKNLILNEQCQKCKKLKASVFRFANAVLGEANLYPFLSSRLCVVKSQLIDCSLL